MDTRCYIMKIDIIKIEDINMYLKSFQINNFRKFRTTDNIIEFASNVKQNEEKLNVAQTTTLIVGKNNCGKTSIIQALHKLINDNTFNSNDFNFFYIKDMLKTYSLSDENFEAPYMKFVITIAINNDSTDLISNLISFMTLDDVKKEELELIIKYEIEDEQKYSTELRKLLKRGFDESQLFTKFLELIDSLKFTINYYNKNGEQIEKFKLSDLINLTPIKANNITGDYCLSKAFSKIIKYRYNNLLEEDKEYLELESSISSINETLTESIKKNHTEYINDSLGKILSTDKLKVLLSSDLSFEKLMNNLVKYEYVEGNIHIPENQFGLGYTNLMEIISEIGRAHV